jgi:sulfide:quinone oxidoreductase
VVIAGGGVAAIEAALALGATAGGRVELTIAAATPTFVYRPLAVVRPFQTDASYRIELAHIVADLGAALVPEDAVAVEPDRHKLRLSGGRLLDYDALLVAIGASAEPVLTGGTFTPWDWGEGHAFRSLLGSLDRGGARTLAFIVPAGLTWPLPLYELALLTDAYLRERAVGGVSLQVITVERAPLEVFGPAASRTVAALLERRGIALATGQETRAVDEGFVRTADGTSIAADATVALPLIQARPLPGLPTDAAGFISVDPQCRVAGSGDVFAAGDCTDQPLKQGGLAAQQADIAAAGIAALAGADVTPTAFQPTLEAVLLTGDTPLHLDATGARPIRSEHDDDDRERREKIFARYLTPYLAKATPALPYLDA